MSWLSKILGDKPAEPDVADEGAAAADAEPGPVATLDHDEVVESLRQHLAAIIAKSGRTVSAAELVTDVDLYEAGYLDSLSASEFLLLAEQQYGVRLPDWLIGSTANTIENLARYIETQSVSQ